MALFRVANERAQFDAASNDARDQYGAGIRFTQEGNARVTTSAGTFYNQGIPMSGTGQVAIVDATAGLPSGTIYHNGLPMSGDKVCVSKNATAVVSNGLPFDSAGALAADINFDLNFIGTDTLNSSVTFTRASTATYFNSAGVLTSAAINEARFDYNPATLAARGLLIEEQRTNLQVNSEDFTNVDWNKGTNTTITGNSTVAPSGQSTADTFGFTAVTSGTCQVSDNQTKAASAITYTGSIYVKATAGLFFHFFVDANGTANSGRVIVDTTNWTVFSSTNAGTFTGTSGTVTSVGNGWYRITCTTTSGTETNIRFNLYWSNSNSTVTFTPSGTEQVYIWGAQLEAGAFPTSYIPTTTTALTRSADVASVNTLSPWYNSASGTLFAEWVTAANDATNNRGIAALDDGSNNNRIAMFVPNSFTPLAVAARVASGGTATNPANAGSIALSSIVKSALTYGVGTNQAALCVNGGTPTTASPAAAPIGVSALRIGAIFGVTQLGGWLRRISYFPRRLADAELQSITS